MTEDNQGNNGSTTFTWNVSHTNQAPTLTNPGDQLDQAGDVVSLPLSGYDGDGDGVSYSVTGLPPGLSLDATSGIITGTLASLAASSTPYSVMVTASDGTLTASQSFNWFVTGNPVTLTSPGDQSNNEGDSVSLQLSASDVNNSVLSYQASGLPSGLSVNSSGLISGTVASGDAANGPYSIIVTATDAQGYTSAQQFAWNVNAANLNPVVTNPGSQINTQGDVLSLALDATDPAGNGLTYTATGLPPGLSINASSGLISGVLPNNSATGSPYSVTVTATDGTYSGNSTFTWSVTNQAVTVTNPGTQSSTGGGAVSLQINASDPAQLPLTYAAAGLPPGATINASTGLISGTLASTDGGAYAVTAMAGDSQGNSGSAAFTWNVGYVNQAPTLANPGDQLNKAGDAVSVQLSGSDVDGDTLSYSATGLPPGLSINSTSGIISGTLSATAAAGTPYSVTVTASDGTLTANQTFNWFVLANPVTLTSPGDQTNTEGDSVSLQLSATDANNSALSYQASGLPSGVSINSGTGLVSGTVASGDSANGPYSVTVTATDAKGYTSAQQFAWNVSAPSNTLTLTNPGSQSNAEGDNVSLQVQASDPDGDTLQYAASGLPIGLMIDPTSGLISGSVDYSAAEIAGGQYNVTVTANDGNGQTTSKSFVWTIADTPQAPWLLNPTVQNSVAWTQASLQLVGASPDGKNLTYSAQNLPPGLTVNAKTGVIGGQLAAQPGSSYQVTATVTDTSNLTASQVFTWQVTASATPQVILAINGSTDPSNDVGIVNPSLTIPLTITLKNATPNQLHRVQITIPSGRSEVDQSQIYLPNGGSTTIWLTPLQQSQGPDDVDIQVSVDGFLAADKKMTNVTVGVEGHIRNTDTPSAMADRIPPSKDAAVKTPIEWTLSTDLGPEEKLFIVLTGDAFKGSDLNPNPDPKAGEAFFWSSENERCRVQYIEEKGTYATPIWGTQQTSPGDAGKIQVFIEYPKGPQLVIKKSEGFSVAAIPVAMEVNLPTDLHGKDYSKQDSKEWAIEWGTLVTVKALSDSLNTADLFDAYVMEVIQPIKRTGAAEVIAGALKTQTKPVQASLRLTDRNGAGVGIAKTVPFAKARKEALDGLIKSIDDKGNGTADLTQYIVFTDKLFLDKEFVVKASGFALTYFYGKEDGKYLVKVTRIPKVVGDAQPGIFPKDWQEPFSDPLT